MNNLPMRKALANRWRGMPACNAGLVYAKYADTWQPKTFAAGGEEKREFYREIIKLMELAKKGQDGKGGPGGRLLEASLKRRQLLYDSLQSPFRKCQLHTQWRMVNGLGISHPFETGLLFDRTYGVPYLPGSSVKGAARSWAKDLARTQENNWSYPLIDKIFGVDEADLAPDTNSSSERGYVIFFDAYPTVWPELDLDIVNPHYGDYHQGKKNTPPGDGLAPTPSYFLAVKPETPWDFCVALARLSPATKERIAREAGVENVVVLVDKAFESLKGAAQDQGLGGKTAVGYGYFEPVNRSQTDKKTA